MDLSEIANSLCNTFFLNVTGPSKFRKEQKKRIEFMLELRYEFHKKEAKEKSSEIAHFRYIDVS